MCWDRYELGQKNIFYDEEIRLFPTTLLPPHVKRVQRSILDFSCAIRGHNEWFDAPFDEGQIKRPNVGSDVDPALKAASIAVNKAKSIVNGGYLEKKWEQYFETHFFEPLSDGFSVSKDDSRRVSRCNYYYDGMKRLVQDSAQHAVALPDHAHIPPIPVVTTIGPRVRVWLMYFAEKFDAPCSHRDTQEVMAKMRNKGYIMRAIWNGDMTKVGDIVRFQIILENTHTWAMRVFKPLISLYIEQWSHVHCRPDVDRKTAQSLSSEAKLRNQKNIEQRRKVIPMVQALLEDQATIELDNRAHQKVTPLLLGLLMHQICSSEREFLRSEVDRVVAEKLEALDLTQELASQASVEDEPEDTSSATQEPPPDNDDPNDSDYRQSQTVPAFGVTDQNATGSNQIRFSIS
ncbi:hypothetical protein N0V84_005481 [Fusarium piperis]|uniref:Uncharacterized protein n=1 Tax=Fusarium piperis TaxID=1435070 RepID=A0A9W8WDJ8_9HYPO|nr:hypothetical protein N0V84_005481 [Fusarium piperis]